MRDDNGLISSTKESHLYRDELRKLEEKTIIGKIKELESIKETINSMKIQNEKDKSLQQTQRNHFVNISRNKEQDKNITNYGAYLNRKIHFNHFIDELYKMAKELSDIDENNLKCIQFEEDL